MLLDSKGQVRILCKYVYLSHWCLPGRTCRTLYPLHFPATMLQPSTSKEPVLPRVICCPRHLSTNSRDELLLSSGSFPLKRLRDVSLARERICGFWSAKAGSRERQRPLTSAPLFHQWGMEGLDMGEKMSVTSQLQVKINVNLNFQPVHGLRALPRLPEGRKRNQKESKQEKKMCLLRSKNNSSGNPPEKTLSFSLKYIPKSLAVPHRMLWLPLSETLEDRLCRWFWLKSSFKHIFTHSQSNSWALTVY